MARHNFSDTQVRNFRREYEQDETLTVHALSRKHGIPVSTMCNLLKGASYGHIPGAVKIRLTKDTGSRMDPKVRAEVLRLAALGYSTDSIHQQTGASTSTVHFLRNGLRDYH